jgi:hypothetical protein
MIEKIHQFSINQAVDAMDDMGWCPKEGCGQPAMVYKDFNVGECTDC